MVALEMARRGGGDSATVVYPPGCREVNDELGNDELIRRLKSLAHTFQGLGQVRRIFNFLDLIRVTLWGCLEFHRMSGMTKIILKNYVSC